MGQRRVPLYKAFQRLMWAEMAADPDWSERMDTLAGQLPAGESWPTERVRAH